MLQNISPVSYFPLIILRSISNFEQGKTMKKITSDEKIGVIIKDSNVCLDNYNPIKRYSSMNSVV